MTIKIRRVLYLHILRKHIGWFDLRENTPGIVTSAMAQDTAIINGVSTESLSAMMEALFGLLVGVGIGFAYCW